MLQRIKNKVVLKIAILVILEIALIVGSFGILSYYQSQQSSLADTINIAGKNRYLTSLLMLQIERCLDRSASISNLTMAMSSLKSNIMSLKQGGFASGIQLQPLPTTFSGMWNSVRAKWNSLFHLF
jgi:hypothetical protein